VLVDVLIKTERWYSSSLESYFVHNPW